MLDIRLLRENAQQVKENLTKRQGYDISIVDKVLEADEKWRAAKKEADRELNRLIKLLLIGIDPS